MPLGVIFIGIHLENLGKYVLSINNTGKAWISEFVQSILRLTTGSMSNGIINLVDVNIGPTRSTSKANGPCNMREIGAVIGKGKLVKSLIRKGFESWSVFGTVIFGRYFVVIVVIEGLRSPLQDMRPIEIKLTIMPQLMVNLL